MIAKRHGIASSKQVDKKKNAGQSDRPKTPKKKPEWDSYQIPQAVAEKLYKLPKDEMLRKKNLLISPHNVLSDDCSLSVRTTSKSVLKERNPNIAHDEKRKSSAHKEKDEKHEVDAIDLLMSAKGKEVNRTVAQKSPIKSRGTSSFSPPTRVIRPKHKEQTSEEDTQQEFVDPDNGEDNSERGLYMASRLVGKSSRHVSAAIASVVKSNRDQLIQEHTFNLSQSLNNSAVSRPVLVPVKDTIVSTSHLKTIRSPSPLKANAHRSRLSTPVSAHSTTTTTTGGVKEKDYDLLYVADEVRALFAELKYYEELSGRKSILDTSEVCFA